MAVYAGPNSVLLETLTNKAMSVLPGELNRVVTSQLPREAQMRLKSSGAQVSCCSLIIGAKAWAHVSALLPSALVLQFSHWSLNSWQTTRRSPVERYRASPSESSKAAVFPRRLPKEERHSLSLQSDRSLFAHFSRGRDSVGSFCHLCADSKVSRCVSFMASWPSHRYHSNHSRLHPSLVFSHTPRGTASCNWKEDFRLATWMTFFRDSKVAPFVEVVWYKLGKTLPGKLHTCHLSMQGVKFQPHTYEGRSWAACKMTYDEHQLRTTALFCICYTLQDQSSELEHISSIFAICHPPPPPEKYPLCGCARIKNGAQRVRCKKGMDKRQNTMEHGQRPTRWPICTNTPLQLYKHVVLI